MAILYVEKILSRVVLCLICLLPAIRSQLSLSNSNLCVQPGRCQSDSDVIFLLDVSDSIDRESLNQQIQIISDVIDQLYINEVSGFRLGVISFSSDVVDVIPFGTDETLLRQRLTLLRHPREGTNTVAALSRMRQMFQRFGRRNTAKIGILMTDGGSWDPQGADDEAFRAKRDNITMATVAVGCLINKFQLENIATRPVYNFRVGHVGLIQRLVSELTTILCPSPVGEETVTTILPPPGTLPPLPFETTPEDTSTRRTGTVSPPGTTPTTSAARSTTPLLATTPAPSVTTPRSTPPSTRPATVVTTTGAPPVVTSAPSTPAATTPAPATTAVTTPSPETLAPATPSPATPAPATPSPVTSSPAIPSPTIPSPATPAPTTPAPATPSPATPPPATPSLATPTATTPSPATPAPATPAPATPSPATPSLATPSSATPAPATPVTPATATPSPATPAPTTAAPTTASTAATPQTPSAIFTTPTVAFRTTRPVTPSLTLPPASPLPPRFTTTATTPVIFITPSTAATTVTRVPTIATTLPGIQSTTSIQAPRTPLTTSGITFQTTTSAALRTPSTTQAPITSASTITAQTTASQIVTLSPQPPATTRFSIRPITTTAVPVATSTPAVSPTPQTEASTLSSSRTPATPSFTTTRAPPTESFTTASVSTTSQQTSATRVTSGQTTTAATTERATITLPTRQTPSVTPPAVTTSTTAAPTTTQRPSSATPTASRASPTTSASPTISIAGPSPSSTVVTTGFSPSIPVVTATRPTVDLSIPPSTRAPTTATPAFTPPSVDTPSPPVDVTAVVTESPTTRTPATLPSTTGFPSPPLVTFPPIVRTTQQVRTPSTTRFVNPPTPRVTPPPTIRTVHTTVRATPPPTVRTTPPPFVRTTPPPSVRTTTPPFVRTTPPPFVRTTARATPPSVRTPPPTTRRVTTPRSTLPPRTPPPTTPRRTRPPFFFTTTPRVVTSRPRRTTTTSAPFLRTSPNPDLPLSLCDGCAIRNGVGYNPHPDRCDWYIHCTFEKEQIVKAQEKMCPLGLFWSQIDVTCRDAKYVDCPADPCRTVRDGLVPDVRDCRAYWSCRDGFTFQASCCPENSGFQNGQCQNNNPCATNCTVATIGIYPCTKESHATNVAMYYEHTVTLGKIERKCPPGVAFDNATCECSKRLAYKETCRPELYLPFDGDFKDKANNNAVGVLGPTIADVDGAIGQAALFTGDDRLSIWRFSNAYFGNLMLIKFRFLPLAPEGGINGIAEALITNSDCGKKSTIEITLERNGQKVAGLIDTDDTGAEKTSVSFLQNGWVEVNYLYNRTEFLLQTRPSSGADSASRLGVTGNIRRNKCALQVGYGTGLTNFTGYIDELYVYFCIPEGF